MEHKHDWVAQMHGEGSDVDLYACEDCEAVVGVGPDEDDYVVTLNRDEEYSELFRAKSQEEAAEWLDAYIER